MLKSLQYRFALSHKGAKDFLKGVFFTVLLDIALMLPAVFTFIYLDDYLKGLDHNIWYFISLGILFMILMFIISIFQYRSTYTSVYEESANRRISLAEKLRILPLAFFGEKNLSDLTSVTMEDSTDLEHTFSHAVPQLFASIISIILIAIGLFSYNWKLSISLFWVVPIAAIIVFFSKRSQHKRFQKGYEIKRNVSEKIQEGLETIQEIKSCNQETSYLKELNLYIKEYEQQQIKGELFTGGIVNSAQSILKLGLASVILTGASLITSGDISLLTYLAFLMVAFEYIHQSTKFLIPFSTFLSG
jgi:ATP-binding cassette subfamily B protein